jgi:NAD(P)-dependent dehydrogenase (short-subunit alcohol dehydrogenase family)
MREKIAIVTGANRGLGLEAVRQLASQGIQVILTCRDAEKGQAATEQLRTQGLNVVFHPLDVTEQNSVHQLKQWVQQQYGRIDILINNAGILPDSQQPTNFISAFDVDINIVQRAMDTNLYGAFRMCQAFIPLMRAQNYGRVVNVSSGMGQLTGMNGGYPAYRISKTALNALTCLLADELRHSNVLINSMCPGWVRTDMGGEHATRDVTQGADTMVWLATLPDGGKSGGFFRDRAEIPW